MAVRPLAVLLLLLATALGVAAGAFAAGAHKSASPPVSRAPLAQEVNPVGARGRTLGLSRVRVAPAARIALHRHPGTQIAYIQGGVLTYSVRRGSVDVMRGAADQSPKLVRRIHRGQTRKIRAGEWIVEKPSTIHQARNDGRAPVVILLATLFTNGSPPSIPVNSRMSLSPLPGCGRIDASGHRYDVSVNLGATSRCRSARRALRSFLTGRRVHGWRCRLRTSRDTAWKARCRIRHGSTSAYAYPATDAHGPSSAA